MPGQQRNRSSSPQKKVKGPTGTVGEKAMSKKEQTQVLQSVKAMFEGQIEPDVIEMVLMEKSWKVEEAVQILSSMMEDEKTSRSDSFSQFDLIAFSLLDSTPDDPEQRKILEEIQSTSVSIPDPISDNTEVTLQAVGGTAEEVSETPKAVPKLAPEKQHSSKKSKKTCVKSEKGQKAEQATSINNPSKQNDNMAAKQIKTPPGLKTKSPQIRDSKGFNLTDSLPTVPTSNFGSILKGDNTNMAGLSNFASGHHNISTDFTIPLQSYLDVYGGNFGMPQENEGFWDLSEQSNNSSTRDNLQITNLTCPSSHEQKGKGHVRSRSNDTCLISQVITEDRDDSMSNVENKWKEKSPALPKKAPGGKSDVPVNPAKTETKADNVTGLISKVDAFLKSSAPVQEGIQKKIKKRTKSKSIASQIQDSSNMATQRELRVKELNKNYKPDKEKPSSSSQFEPKASSTPNFSMAVAAETQPSSSKLCPQAPIFQPQQVKNSDLFAGPPVFMTPVGPRISPPKPHSGSSNYWVRSNRPQSPHFRTVSPKFGLQKLPLTIPPMTTDDTGFVPVVHKHHHHHHNQQKQKSGKELFHKYQREGRLALVLLRGLPGSGKSYLAKEIVGEGIVLSTDDYFIKEGVYQYDPNELSTAHTWNKQRAINAMEARINPVIIDNTNTKVWEMKPYAKSAVQNGYSIVILEPDTPWKLKSRELQVRNSHGVSKENINKMKDRYDHNVTVEQLLYTDKPVQPTLKTAQTYNTSKNNNSKTEMSGGIKIESAQHKLDSTSKSEDLLETSNRNLNVKKEESSDSGINMEEGIQSFFKTKKEEEKSSVEVKTETMESKPASETQDCQEYSKCTAGPWNEGLKEEPSSNKDASNSWKGEGIEPGIATHGTKSFPSIKTEKCKVKKEKLPSPKPMRPKKRNRHNSAEVKIDQASEIVAADAKTIQDKVDPVDSEVKTSVKILNESDKGNEACQEKSPEAQNLDEALSESLNSKNQQFSTEQHPLELNKADDCLVTDSNDCGKSSEEACPEILKPKSKNSDSDIEDKDESKMANISDKSKDILSKMSESSTEESKSQRIRHSSSKSSNSSEASYSNSAIIPDELSEKLEDSSSEEFYDANTSLNQGQNISTLTENIQETDTEKEDTIQNPLLDIELESSGKRENNSDSNQKSPRRKNRRKKRTGKPLLDKEFRMKIKTESWNSFTVEDFKEAILPVISIPECQTETNVSDSSTLTEGLDFKFLDNVNMGFVDPTFKDYTRIVAAKCCMINENTPDAKNSILRTFGLDKGCMTDDLFSSLEPNLDFLRTSFPELSDERCKEILEMCQNDVEWAINLILDCDPTVSLTSGEREEIASEVIKLKRGNSVTSADVNVSVEEKKNFMDSFSPKSLFDICNDQIKASHVNFPEIQQTLIKNGMKQLEQMEKHALTRMKSISHENVLEGDSLASGGEEVTNQKVSSSVKSSHGYTNSISYILNEDILRREGVVEETQGLKMLGSYDSSDSSDENETWNSVFQSSLKKVETSAAIPKPGTSLLHLLTPSKAVPSTNITPHSSSSLNSMDSAIISAMPAVSAETSLKTVPALKTSDKCNEREIKVHMKDNSSLENTSKDLVLVSESDEILAEIKEVTPVKTVSVSRDISSPIDDIETELSVKLSSTLVNQLEQLFGQITQLDNQDDQEIYLDLKAAKHLHRCLKLTSRNQTIEKHAQLRNDEALARRMQEEENKPRIRVKPKIQPKPVYLEDIIQEELARKISREKYMKYIEATGDHIAIATKLKRQKLLQKFPGLDETFFEEIFQANGYSYEDTESALKSAIGPHIPVKTVMTPEAEEEYYSKLIDEAKQNSLLDMVDSPSTKKVESKEYQGIELHDLDYQDLRGEADLHRRLRQQCFVKAREAFQRGMREVSSFYSKQGHLHSQKLKDANVRASQKILESRQIQVQREMTLDLHGFHVEEAIEVLNRIMEQKEKEFSARPDRRRQHLYVITGRGLNSRGGVAKIRPAILSHLKSCNVRFTEEKPGLLKVQLKYNPKT